MFPEPTVGGLVFYNGKMLLIKSHKWNNKYVVPGGHIELGETMRDALKREIKEETNLDVEVRDLIDVQEFVYGPEFWKKKHFIFLDFVCSAKNDDVRLNSEAEEYVWVTPEQALEMDVEPYSMNAIRAYLQSRL